MQQAQSDGKESVEMSLDDKTKREISKMRYPQEISKMRSRIRKYFQRLPCSQTAQTISTKMSALTLQSEKFKLPKLEKDPARPRLAFICSDIQETLYKHCFIKPTVFDTKVIARDSTGQSRGCFFLRISSTALKQQCIIRVVTVRKNAQYL